MTLRHKKIGRPRQQNRKSTILVEQDYVFINQYIYLSTYVHTYIYKCKHTAYIHILIEFQRI